MPVKYIFVTGGVVSGLGKGITAASLGRLLKARGLRVTMQKFDPYLNVDPGTMSPYQHGEVFVTEDGAETDLDLGHYERFIDENLGVNSNITTGKVYFSVISRERAGDYIGGTVQVIPHITNEIKDRVYKVGSETDVVITEIGGTVGDIESQPFLEAIRQVSVDVGKENVLYLHVSLIVAVPLSNELKSKPTQHSVKELLGLGIQPDIIVCRTETPLSAELRAKIGLFCNMPAECVIQNMNAVDSLYEVPLMLAEEGLDAVVCRKLGLLCHEPDLTEWRDMVRRMSDVRSRVTIGLVGKYIALRDAYLSVAEALRHGGIENSAQVDIRWINSEELCDASAEEILKGCDGILVPGGFGDRGVEGKISAARYAREKGVPYFGICLGMHMAVVEFARNVCGMDGAQSAEFLPDAKYPVIDIMPGQREVTALGGTMRLGKYPCSLEPGSIAASAYGAPEISERHRHRYELNNDFRDRLHERGLSFSGVSPDGSLVEIVEIPGHPWFVGVQFHPEFKSRPNRAHPLFRDFIRAAVENGAGTASRR